MRALGIGKRLIPVLLLLVALSGCREKLLKPVGAWLMCEECTDGERAAVRALGDTAVPQLASALLDGPSEHDREVVEKRARSAHARAGVGALSADRYATQLVANYVAKHQDRAAVALGDIRTPRARSALDEALGPAHRAQYRADVLRTIRLARAAIDATPFGGRFERRLVGFGDTAFLLAPPARPFSANDVVVFDDSVFPPAEMVLSLQPNRRGIAAVGAPGSHFVGVRRAGTRQTEVAGLTITSIADANDRVMQKCPDRACEVSRSPLIPAAALPYKSFLSLWSMPPQRDSLDMFRFEPSSPLHVTAQLDWRGPGNLDLLWRTCKQFAPVGNSDGATAAKNPEKTSVDIPAGACWLLLVALNSRLPEPTFAQVRLTP